MVAIPYTSIWIKERAAERTTLHDDVSAIYVRSFHATIVKLSGISSAREM